MTSTQLKRYLLRELDAQLGRDNFARTSHKVHGNRYERRFDEGAQRIHVSVLTRPDSVVVEVPAVSIRFDEVEETVARLEDPHPLVTPSDIAARSTLSLSLENGFLAPLTRKQWTLRREEEASEIAAEVAKFALGKSSPLFHRFSGVEGALAALQGDDERARSLAAPDDARAKKAAVLAWLCSGQDGAMRMVEEKLRALSGTALESFQIWSDRFIGSFKAVD